MQVEEIQGHKFESKHEANEFASMNQIKREIFIQRLLRDNVKRAFKDTVYMYSLKTQLWEVMKQSEFETWTTCFYDATVDNCLQICSKSKEKNASIKVIWAQFHAFLLGSLFDALFFTAKLDKNFGYIPIKNTKKMVINALK